MNRLKTSLGHASRRTVRSTRKGAAAVEFAVASGIAFFLFFSALEFCRFFQMRQVQELALYEGGRQGVVAGATSSEVRDEAQRILSISGIKSATIDVTPTAIVDDTESITVRIRIPLDVNMFGPVRFFSGKTLDRTLVLQREGNDD